MQVNGSCDTCKNNAVPQTEQPCFTCLYRGRPNWEPIDSVQEPQPDGWRWKYGDTDHHKWIFSDAPPVEPKVYRLEKLYAESTIRAAARAPVAVIQQGAAYGPPEFRAKVKKVDLLVDPTTLEAGTVLYPGWMTVCSACVTPLVCNRDGRCIREKEQR